MTESFLLYSVKCPNPECRMELTCDEERWAEWRAMPEQRCLQCGASMAGLPVEVLRVAPVGLNEDPS